MEGEELGLIVNFIRLFSSPVLYAMPSCSIDPRSPALSSVAAEAMAAFPHYNDACRAYRWHILLLTSISMQP